MCSSYSKISQSWVCTTGSSWEERQTERERERFLVQFHLLEERLTLGLSGGRFLVDLIDLQLLEGGLADGFACAQHGQLILDSLLTCGRQCHAPG